MYRVPSDNEVPVQTGAPGGGTWEGLGGYPCWSDLTYQSINIGSLSGHVLASTAHPYVSMYMVATRVRPLAPFSSPHLEALLPSFSIVRPDQDRVDRGTRLACLVVFPAQSLPTLSLCRDSRPSRAQRSDQANHRRADTLYSVPWTRRSCSQRPTGGPSCGPMKSPRLPQCPAWKGKERKSQGACTPYLRCREYKCTSITPCPGGDPPHNGAHPLESFQKRSGRKCRCSTVTPVHVMTTMAFPFFSGHGYSSPVSSPPQSPITSHRRSPISTPWLSSASFRLLLFHHF